MSRSDAEPLERPRVDALDLVLGVAIPVLDHGFIRVIDYMGDEAAIVQAARVSYGKGTSTAREDRGLIRYLMRHRHTTPFEMCEIKLHVKLPIFVARQWIRHRTANVNEYSGRYSILDREFYIPRPGDIQYQSKTNKQGRAGEVPDDYAAYVISLMKREAERQYITYEHLLNDIGDGNPKEPGEPMIARELARMGLGLNFYTQWYWKIDLHNLLHFLSLRCDPHAQYEIRAYAEVIAGLVAGWVPATWEAFEDYRLDAHTFSGQEMKLLRHLLSSGVPVPYAPADQDQLKALADRYDLGSVRERAAFWRAIGVF